MRNCLESRNYRVEVIHGDNCGLPWRSRSKRKYVAYVQDLLLGYYVGREASKKIRRGGRTIAAVVSSGLVGWYPVPGVPQAHVYHGTYREQAEAIRPLISTLGYWKLKWWDSMVLERASGRSKRVVVNSDQTAQEIKRYFGHDCTTVWCPLDTAHFRPLDKATCRRALKIPEDRPVGRFVGNTQPMKRFEIVRHLIDRLPDVYWVIALRGELPEDLRDNDAVRVFHNAAYGELPSLYASADFSLSPSRYEPFGYVVAESLACGTPVIAGGGGASRLLLREPPLREMLVLDGQNPESFLAAVRTLLLNPTPYRAAALQNARPLIEKLLSTENWYKQFAEATGL